MNDATIRQLAARLDAAVLRNQRIEQLVHSHPELDLPAAYRVQRAGIALRQARGDGLVGMKMGLTSHAKMAQVGVHQPIYAHLTSTMRIAPMDPVRRTDHGHPRAEPEIAFVLGADLRGPTDAASAMAAVATVHPALEVIDSRYADFRFALPDVVADNASSCLFAIGAGTPADQLQARGIDLGDLAMSLNVDGDPVHEGNSSAILGHPAASLAALANLLAEVGESLRAGMVVLAGAATPAVHIASGTSVRAVVEDLGEVGFDVE